MYKVAETNIPVRNIQKVVIANYRFNYYLKLQDELLFKSNSVIEIKFVKE